MKALLLLVLAGVFWCRDLAWLPRAAETLPALAGLPLFFWFARPRLSPEVHPRILSLALALLVLGGLLDLSWLLAAGFTVLLAALVERTPRVMLHLPLVFLAFPWLTLEGESLGWWLRLSGAWATEEIFGFIGFKVQRQGTNILLPGLTLGVDAACAGLNVLQAALVGGLTVLFWERRLTRLGQIPWAFLLLIAMAWLSNVARLVTIAAIGLTLGADVARGPLHEQSGLVVLVGMLALLNLRLSPRKNQ